MAPYGTVGTDDRESRGRLQGLLTLGVIGLAIFLAYLPVAHQRRVGAAVRATALRPFLVAQRALGEAQVRAAETARLRAQLDSLVIELRGEATLREENLRLRALLELREHVGPEFRPAEVVRPGLPASENMFLVDVGSADEIALGAPVMTAEGLVGAVRDVGAHVSVGMDWGHPDFRASAMTVDGSAYGIVEPRRGRFREDDHLVLTGTTFHTDLKPGTLIVTSGRGGIYPRGIPIGAVLGLEQAEAGWRKSYWLQAVVHPGSVTHALVGVRRRSDEVPTDTVLNAARSETWDLSFAWPQLRAAGVDSAAAGRAGPAASPAGRQR